MISFSVTNRLSALGLLLLVLSPPLTAKPDALTPEELLASSATHYPQIIQALAARRMAAGKQLEAEGAFDVVFDVSGFGRTSGFYDGSGAIEGKVQRQFQPLGARVYGGYKLSEGELPVYEDEFFTNSGGTVQVGVLFSLLRDRDIDPARFGLTDAEIAVREADLEVMMTRIGVQQRALDAYWRWVKSGRQLGVYEELRSIAMERQEGLEAQVRRGAIAEIFMTENLQNITRRQILVTAAQRDLETAANALSMYYRDALGNPLVPQMKQLPAEEPIESIASVSVDGAAAVARALQRRPELGLLLAAIEREQERIALRENALKPRLDLGVEVQQGLGSVAEGGDSRDSTDTVFGITFSMPLERRAEKGRLEQTRASLAAAEIEQQFRGEQIELEIRNLLLDLTYASKLALLADRQVDQTELMRVSELRRFQSGASDFFLVNLREESAADAQVLLYEAALNIHLARAAFDAATINFERLGLAADGTPR